MSDADNDRNNLPDVNAASRMDVGKDHEAMKVICFHNVMCEPLDEFDRQLERKHINGFIRTITRLRAHYEIRPLGELLDRLQRGDPAAGALAITFDDGFAGVYEVARPVLSEVAVTAAVFVVTEPAVAPTVGFSPNRLLHFERLEIAFRLTRKEWLDASTLGAGVISLRCPRERAREMTRLKTLMKHLPAGECERAQCELLTRLGVTDDEIEEFASKSTKFTKLSADQLGSLIEMGWTVGGHTRTHRPLSSLHSVELVDEVAGCRDDLFKQLGQANPPFAYPYGTIDLIGSQAPEVVRQAGFCCAFTTKAEPCVSNSDLFQLGRYSEMALLVDVLTVGAE
jgi:peptidoglycan/xylan/chitin deacetylase (PgdA/CDA1 family)